MQTNTIYQIRKAELILKPNSPLLVIECRRPGLMLSVPLDLERARQLMKTCELDLSQDACSQLVGTYVTVEFEPKVSGRAHAIGNVFGMSGISLGKPVEQTSTRRQVNQTKGL